MAKWNKPDQLPSRLVYAWVSDRVLVAVMNAGATIYTVGAYDYNRDSYATDLGRYPIGYVLGWREIEPILQQEESPEVVPLSKAEKKP
jgi:hypothetical protein